MNFPERSLIVSEIGRMIIIAGILLIGIGLLILILGKVPGMGRLPGDILIRKENFSFYFPLTTCLVISAVISLILYLWNRK